MDINEFVNKFAGEFEDTASDLFSPQTPFKELEEWSSFLALSIMAMVEENYEVELTAADINGSNTLQDLYDIIKSRN